MYHSAEIRSNGSINSNSTIKSNEKGASTTFNLSSQGGTMEESVASFDDKKHRQSIIETRMNGSMDIFSSHLVDDTKAHRIFCV